MALLASGRWRDRRALLLVLASALALAANLAALGVAPRLFPDLAAGLQWNWIGKIAAIATTLAAYALLTPALRRETGLFALPRPPEWGSVIAVSLATVALFVAVVALLGEHEPADAETLLYQATMPGLDEESSFRGVLLALLVGAFGKPHRVAGVQVGWGALPVVLFFGIAHTLGVVMAGHIVWGDFWTTLLLTGGTGAALLWLKERTGSIWVPVLVHNLCNVGGKLVAASL